MKKALILIMALIMLVGVAGCSSAPVEEDAAKPAPTTEAAETAPEQDEEPSDEDKVLTRDEMLEVAEDIDYRDIYDAMKENIAAASDTYVGKICTFVMSASNIESDHIVTKISGKLSTDFKVYFADQEELISLKKGEYYTFVGKIAEITQFDDVIIENTYIVESNSVEEVEPEEVTPEETTSEDVSSEESDIDENSDTPKPYFDMSFAKFMDDFNKAYKKDKYAIKETDVGFVFVLEGEESKILVLHDDVNDNEEGSSTSYSTAKLEQFNKLIIRTIGYDESEVNTLMLDIQLTLGSRVVPIIDSSLKDMNHIDFADEFISNMNVEVNTDKKTVLTYTKNNYKYTVQAIYDSYFNQIYYEFICETV